MGREEAEEMAWSIEQARYGAYCAIMVALAGTVSVPTHREYLRQLDERLADPRLKGKTRYPAIAYRDPTSGKYIASIPDIPQCIANGKNAEEAFKRVTSKANKALAERAAQLKDIPQVTLETAKVWLQQPAPTGTQTDQQSG